jgi:methionine-rich copper-binding protein CopC
VRNHLGLPLRLNRARWAVAAALALFVAFTWVDSNGTAFAHAHYESSTPADGEVVAEPPRVVEVFFSQEVARGGGLPAMIVVNESGDQVDLGATLDDADRTRMVVDLPPELPEGRYAVIWHTLSDEDGEEAQGAFHFFIGTGPGATTPAPGSATAVEPTEAPTPNTTGDDSDDSDGISPAIFAIGLLLTAGLAGGAGLFLGRRSSA